MILYSQVWLSFWLLPFGAMLLALVGDEMSDLVPRLGSVLG